MKRRQRKPLYVAGIIESHDNHVLIALPGQSAVISRLWQFPRGAAEPGESAESAMRRVAEHDLNIGVEIVVGQPPLEVELDRRAVELRYFFCGVIHGEPQRGPYSEIRWVLKGHLREYELDDASRPVAQWLLESI